MNATTGIEVISLLWAFRCRAAADCLSSSAREDTNDFRKVSSQPVFVSVCRLTPRGHRTKCSPRFARRWSPVPPSDFLNTTPTLDSPVQEVHHSKETHLHPHHLTPTPNTCSLNSSGSHVPPDVLKHSQHSAKPPSAFNTRWMKRVVVTSCFTRIVSLLHRPQYMLPTARMRQITVPRTQHSLL